MLWIKGLKAPNPNVDIPWDLGFQQGTDDWVTNYAAGLGKGANANNAWTDSNGNELWVLLTQFLGGDGNPDGLALLLDSINGQKGSLFGLKAPTTNAVVSGNIG